MLTVKRLIKAVTYCKELPPINCMTLQGGGHASSRDKLNTFQVHQQKTHGHQTRQGADLPVKGCHH